MRPRWRIATAVVVALGVWATAVGAAAAQGTISATCTSGGQTQPCSSAWYHAAVTVVWELSSSAAGPPSGCVPDVQYSYATDGVTYLSCAATWSDGTASSFSFHLHVEVSSPTATAVPARPPDANGWYNHPVAVSFQGSAFSGIASCAPVQSYGGPNTPGVTLAGSCTDNAGKTATASLNLPYDATPPMLDVVARPGDGVVNLDWRATSDLAPIASLEVSRSPGPRAGASSEMYKGNSGAYRDNRVLNGVRYHYTLTAEDQAGNVSVRNIFVTPGPRLLSPVSGSHVSAPPTLSWTPVPKATYYNVQLYQGTKVLSAWPKKARLRLGRSWTFAGRRHRLGAGRYRWYVWPGFGSRKAARYGRMVGTGTFVVR